MGARQGWLWSPPAEANYGIEWREERRGEGGREERGEDGWQACVDGKMGAERLREKTQQKGGEDPRTGSG